MRAITRGGNLTANTATTIYTVPTGYYAKWNLMYLLNGTGSTKNISVTWHDHSANTNISILSDYGLTSKTYFKLDGGAYMVLEAGDYITMTSEAGSTMSYICTFEVEKKEGL
jgi:hypothetical protein